jgi:hypothetical protein
VVNSVFMNLNMKGLRHKNQANKCRNTQRKPGYKNNWRSWWTDFGFIYKDSVQVIDSQKGNILEGLQTITITPFIDSDIYFVS